MNKEKIKQAIKLLEESAHPFDAAAMLLRESLEETPTPKKQIDWDKMPVDTLVEASADGVSWYKWYFAGIDEEGETAVYINGATGKTTQSTVHLDHIRLIEQPTITFWQGGECPIPDGVRFEVHFRNNSVCGARYAASELAWGHNGSALDIIGYRILGPAER